MATCDVPSLTLGPCDLPRGHEGEMHGSAGDGFYARCGTCRRPLEAGKWSTHEDGYACHNCAPRIFRFHTRELTRALLVKAHGGSEDLKLDGGRRLSPAKPTRPPRICKPGKCGNEGSWHYTWPRGNSAQLAHRCTDCAVEVVFKLGVLVDPGLGPLGVPQ